MELPVAGQVDLRTWDAGIDGHGWRLRVDAETHIGDVQAVLRRFRLKRRDSRVDAVLLLLAETRHHRHVLELISRDLEEQFPISARRALAALRAGQYPGGDAVILL
ncbi:MAG TPA: hypothetical protein VF484_03270 [Candidatus Limnocylindrales bacterium]